MQHLLVCVEAAKHNVLSGGEVAKVEDAAGATWLVDPLLDDHAEDAVAKLGWETE